MKIRRFSIFRKSSTDLEIESYQRARGESVLLIVPSYEALLMFTFDLRNYFKQSSGITYAENFISRPKLDISKSTIMQLTSSSKTLHKTKKMACVL
jgi:hypothetical protein